MDINVTKRVIKLLFKNLGASIGTVSGRLYRKPCEREMSVHQLKGQTRLGVGLPKLKPTPLTRPLHTVCMSKWNYSRLCCVLVHNSLADLPTIS